MSDIEIHGPPQSSYVRTVRMAVREKGAEHRLVPIEFKSEAHLAQHPFGRVPAFRHGDVELFETLAMVTYLDAVLTDGPSLTPSSPVEAARAAQWASAFNCYVYEPLIKNYVLKYVFAGEQGPDRTAIDGAVPEIQRVFSLLETQLQAGPFLAGSAFSYADLFWAPPVHTASHFPEVGAALAERPRLTAWLEGMRDRPGAEYIAVPR